MKGKLFLTFALAAALMITGCGAKTDTPSSGSPAQGQEQPVQAGAAGDTYVISEKDSTASYSVHEQLLQQNLPNVAVGKTSAIKGQLVLENGVLKASTVTVDVTTLKSDRAQRDNVLKTRALETATYPTATFALAGMEGVSALTAGQEAAFKLKGNLTLHGVEKAVVWDAKAVLVGSTLRLTGTITFPMADFQIEPPNVLNVISVEDKVQLDVDLVATKQ